MRSHVNAPVCALLFELIGTARGEVSGTQAVLFDRQQCGREDIAVGMFAAAIVLGWAAMDCVENSGEVR